MKLRWSARSPFVRKVMVSAHELGVVDRIELVRTNVVMTKPNLDLMQTNPLGRIPTLETDDGQILFDSAVICEYLDGLQGRPRLFPPEPGRKWTALRRHALATGMLETLVLWRNENLRSEAQRSAELTSAFALKIRTSLPVLEREAAALGSTPLDIGHVAVGCALGYIDFRFPDMTWRTGRDRLAGWYENFAGRPSMQATIPADT